MIRENSPAEILWGQLGRENPNAVIGDDRFIYSASGKAYARARVKDASEADQRRLPFIKRVVRSGRTYLYFVGPQKKLMIRLPDFTDIGFDHAYLSALAVLEGLPPPVYIPPPKASVYFIGHIDFAIKIGMATNVKRRMADLQSHSPLQLTLFATTPGGLKIEKGYHARFTDHRLHGEWFSPHPDILAEIARLTGATP